MLLDALIHYICNISHPAVSALCPAAIAEAAALARLLAAAVRVLVGVSTAAADPCRGVRSPLTLLTADDTLVLSA